MSKRWPYLSRNETEGGKVLDKAANDLCGYWTRANFNTFPVIPIAVPCKIRKVKFQLADEVVSFLAAPLRVFHNGKRKKELEEFWFLVKHVDRRHNEITFAKYQSNNAIRLLKKLNGNLFEPNRSRKPPLDIVADVRIQVQAY